MQRGWITVDRRRWWNTMQWLWKWGHFASSGRSGSIDLRSLKFPSYGTAQLTVDRDSNLQSPVLIRVVLSLRTSMPIKSVIDFNRPWLSLKILWLLLFFNQSVAIFHVVKFPEALKRENQLNFKVDIKYKIEPDFVCFCNLIHCSGLKNTEVLPRSQIDWDLEHAGCEPAMADSWHLVDAKLLRH